jgi:hypothetical protein
MFNITKPLPTWAIQLIYFAYSFCFVGGGLAYFQAHTETVATLLVSFAPVVHGLLVAFVGKEPENKSE